MRRRREAKVGKPGNSDDDAPQIAPVAHLAIGAFSQLGPEERKDLAEAAEEGDEEALEELRAERVEAIEAMIGAMEDEESRRLIGLGMMLGYTYTGDDRGFIYTERSANLTTTTQTTTFAHGDPTLSSFNLGHYNDMLDMVQEQLQAQLNIFVGKGDDPTDL